MKIIHLLSSFILFIISSCVLWPKYCNQIDREFTDLEKEVFEFNVGDSSIYKSLNDSNTYFLTCIYKKDERIAGEFEDDACEDGKGYHEFDLIDVELVSNFLVGENSLLEMEIQHSTNSFNINSTADNAQMKFYISSSGSKCVYPQLFKIETHPNSSNIFQHSSSSYGNYTFVENIDSIEINNKQYRNIILIRFTFSDYYERVLNSDSTTIDSIYYNNQLGIIRMKCDDKIYEYILKD